MPRTLLSIFGEIPDPRRGQGKMYPLAPILLFTVLAMLSGAVSYRQVHAFIKAHLDRLNAAFDLSLKRAPAYSSVRFILHGLDGKTLRGSFDAFNDRKAAHLMSAFAHDDQIILAHLAIDEKSNEIPAVQDMIATLGRELGGLSGRLFTVDAMHAQKNIRGGVGNGQSSGRPAQEQPANSV